MLIDERITKAIYDRMTKTSSTIWQSSTNNFVRNVIGPALLLFICPLAVNLFAYSIVVNSLLIADAMVISVNAPVNVQRAGLYV